MSEQPNKGYSNLVTTQQKNGMFTFLLTSVILGAGTYILYQYLFVKSDDEEEEYPQAYNSGEDDAKEEAEEENAGPKIKIFYGSQSGTAEGFAFDMQKECKKFGFNGKVVDLEDYDTEELQNETCVIFLVATYGEGEPTDNAQEFYNWLSSSDRIEAEELSNVEFAVFGLGNSQYEFFCEMGKQFDQLLEKLGGTRLIERGVSDDDLSPPEDQFNEWKKKLWPILSEKYLGVSVDMSAADKFESSIKIEYILSSAPEASEESKSPDADGADAADAAVAAPGDDAAASKMSSVNKAIHEMASLVKYPFLIQYNEALQTQFGEHFGLLEPFRKPHWMDQCVTGKMVIKDEARPSVIDGSSLHIEFDVSECERENFSYQTADNLGICVRNDFKLVAKLCKRLGFRPDDVVRILPVNESETLQLYVPKVSTVRNLFLWHLDITEMPRKGLLSVLAQFAQDDGDRAELMKMAETGVNKNDYLTFYQILERFPSVQMDLATVIEVLRPLQPRLFTIASSNKVQPKKIATLNKMEFEFKDAFEYSSYNLSRVSLKSEEDAKESDGEAIPLDRFYSDTKFEGACSHYLFNSKVGESFQVYVQPSSFSLPATKVPVIMISSGAGLAPFKAFLQEGNDIIKSGKHKIEELGEWWCIFGCRSVKIDYIYKDYLESSMAEKGGCLKELKVAFSRDKEGKKVYVQDVIDQNSEKLWQLINEEKGKIYVCGGTAMGKGVRQAFARIFDFYNKGNGQQYLDDMLKRNQFVQELWG